MSYIDIEVISVKKRLISIIFALVLLTGTASASILVSDVDYPIIVNGTAMTFTDARPVNINGRTLLPLRAVSEAVGVDIQWNEAARQVTIDTVDIEALKDASVMLRVGYGSGKQGTQASGVLIDYDEILTAYHAVDEGASVFKAVYDDGTERTLTLTDTAPGKDAATLRPENTSIKPVKIGDSDTVRVGDTVYVVSSPKGSRNVVETSKVIKTNSVVNGIYGIEIKTVSNEGGSGGAIFNTKGELIGILQSGDNVSVFAIPINDIRQSLAS
jgi:S1-C subfamily serine protease